ncbi:MAG: glycine betaine ABC transporter substrate-binding protein [Polyangiales bacterium]
MQRYARGLAGLAAFVLATLLLFWGTFRFIDATKGPRADVVIGSKSFTESLIISEILAQSLEANTKLRIDRQFYLGSTQICFEALKAGRIDLYPEYTGTGLTALLHVKPTDDIKGALDTVRREFHSRFSVTWMEPLGFNNAYAMALPAQLAAKLGIKTISDLKAHPELRAVFAPEFMAREDGYTGLRARYGLHFNHEPQSMDAGLMYQAAAAGEVDLVSAYSTDGRVLSMNLTLLDDDLHYFPPYQAVPVARDAFLTAHPVVREVFDALAATISDEEIRRMNLAVDSGKSNVASVARAFLAQRKARQATDGRDSDKGAAESEPPR